MSPSSVTTSASSGRPAERRLEAGAESGARALVALQSDELDRDWTAICLDKAGRSVGRAVVDQDEAAAVLEQRGTRFEVGEQPGQVLRLVVDRNDEHERRVADDGIAAPGRRRALSFRFCGNAA